MKKNKFLFILPIALGLVACEPEFEDINPSYSDGSADFSNYVAVGNSLTAGFQNAALRREKQELSMSAMIAGQLNLVGGGSFKQPLMDPGVGLGSGGNAELELVVRTNCAGEPSPTPAPIAAQGQIDQLIPANYVGADGPFNNVGVPGAKSFHLLAPGYGDPAGLTAMPPTANPFYVRFANPTDYQETMLGAAMRANPTFFSLWIGNNDVLGYATSGGNNPNEQITNPTTFAGVYNQLISTLTSNGAKGVVANIPDITSIPFFTTIPIGTDRITVDQATALNSPMAYGAYNAGLQNAFGAGAIDTVELVRRTINFTGGQINTFIVVDPSLTAVPNLPSWRHIVPGELLTLTTSSDSLTCFGLGTQIAIQPSNHLTLDEVKAIDDAVAAYNTTIKAAADANGLAFVDANAELNKLATNGISENGVLYTSAFATGGAFSLDGVHPSSRGYAIIANLFIDATNRKYSSSIPKVNVNSFPAIE